jgi:hypothetical protein
MKIRLELRKAYAMVIKPKRILSDSNKWLFSVLEANVGRGFLEIYSVSSSKDGRLTSDSNLCKVKNLRRI